MTNSNSIAVDPGDSRLRDSLISAMTHDLRSPIGAVSIFCEILLMQKEKLDEQQQQNLGMIMEATSKAQRIIDDAVELSRIYKGTVTLQPGTHSLEALVSEALSKMEQPLQKKALMIVRDGNEHQSVYCDFQHSVLVLLRLLEEAIAYASRGGTLTISSSDTSSGAELRISAGELTAPPNRPSSESVKGRLGNAPKNESPYSLAACTLLLQQMGGSLHLENSHGFSAILQFRTIS